MDETRDRAYLQLIHALLNCPNGEEPQILQEHLELLDSGFLETCKLVASTLAAQGGKNDANYLVNLASKLAEFMDESNPETENPQEYSNFILELLQAEQDSGGDIKVIYPMLAQRQYLLNLRFAETLQQVVQRFLAEHPETVGSILHDVENLSIDISKFPCGNRMKNLEIAITGYQIVLNNRQPESEKYAQTQNNLAIAYGNRINGSRADN